MLIDNKTPFAVERAGISDENGENLLLTVVKATWEYDHTGKLRIAQQQNDISFADEYFGDPESTSIRYSADFSYDKLSTDIALSGHACAPYEGARESDVSFRVGEVSREVAVFGNRVWKKRLGFYYISEPQPFTKIPLIWENAFGGRDMTPEKEKRRGWEVRNPVGRGFRAKGSRLEVEDTLLPNFEDPNNLITSPNMRPEPAGFGFIGPSWKPRADFAGTYDEEWQKTRLPLLPLDFDKRFFNAACPELVYPGFITGGEVVEIRGTVPGGVPLYFTVPTLSLGVKGVLKDGSEHVPQMYCDKLIVDCDASQLVMVWIGCLRLDCDFLDVGSVEYDFDSESPLNL
ncbi:putative exported protein [Chitinispirillum alkaliphilum]|nr:putative exported protein [Chitinispirillum alkaliphilum]